MRSRCIIFTLWLISLHAAGSVHAQESDVRADVSETLAALASEIEALPVPPKADALGEALEEAGHWSGRSLEAPSAVSSASSRGPGAGPAHPGKRSDPDPMLASSRPSGRRTM